VHQSLKIKFKKNEDGGMPMRSRDPFSIITRYRNFSIFKMAAVRYLGFLKLKFLTATHFKTLGKKFFSTRTACNKPPLAFLPLQGRYRLIVQQAVSK